MHWILARPVVENIGRLGQRNVISDDCRDRSEDKMEQQVLIVPPHLEQFVYLVSWTSSHIPDAFIQCNLTATCPDHMLSCSTDEGALVRAAQNLGFVFSGRTPDCVIVEWVSRDVLGIDDELHWEHDSPSVMLHSSLTLYTLENYYRQFVRRSPSSTNPLFPYYNVW